MEVGYLTPLLDMFKQPDIDRDLKLVAASGTLTLRPDEHRSLLELLAHDADGEVSRLAAASLALVAPTDRAATEVPQVAQKRAPAVTVVPQARQKRVARAAPHWAQNAPVPATPHAGQGRAASDIRNSSGRISGSESAEEL